VDRLIIGLPLLPSGKEGAQAQHVRGIAETLEKSGIAVTLLDERYSSPRTKSADPDAAAALNLLQTITSSHLTSPPEKGERVG
jgi:RNase H-fold protein (predicted Holliday junction resolvase)